MRINVYIIEKSSKDRLYQPLTEHFKKLSKNYAKIEVFQVFSKDIAKSQDITPEIARASYTKAFEKYVRQGYSVALDPGSKEVDSFEFAEILRDKSEVSFFIGGAYGFERKFLNKSNKAVSFGKITLSHKLIKVVLMEQIFRGLTIIHNHPYHK